MKKHTLLKRATVAALLSASLATPAVIGLTAGTANAMPIESPNCRAIAQSFDSAIYAASVARQQGDTKAEADWTNLANRALRNHNRHCL